MAPEKENLFDIGKKAAFFFHAGSWIVRILFLIADVVIVVFMIGLYTNSQFKFAAVEADVVMGSMLSSPAAAGYVDPFTGRYFPQMIDLDKFNNEQFMNALSHPSNNIVAAALTLNDSAGMPIKTIFYNEQWYERWEPVASFTMVQGIKGIGAIDVYSKTFPVIIKDGEGLKAGTIDIRLLMPRG
jgi:hypothetical protein